MLACIYNYNLFKQLASYVAIQLDTVAMYGSLTESHNLYVTIIKEHYNEASLRSSELIKMYIGLYSVAKV